MLHPTSKGIIDGRIIGLNNSIHITSYILNNGRENLKVPDYYSSPGVEYYIGFGTGYELGQKIRKLLEQDTSSKMLLNEKIKCLTFLLEKQEICREDVTQSFLDNIKYWDEFDISLNIINEIKILLEENKIQRSVDKLFSYFKDNFRLKPLMQFYEVRNQLKKIREQKKKNKEYLISERLEKIKAEMYYWIDGNKQKITNNNL